MYSNYNKEQLKFILRQQDEVISKKMTTPEMRSRLEELARKKTRKFIDLPLSAQSINKKATERTKQSPKKKATTTQPERKSLTKRAKREYTKPSSGILEQLVSKTPIPTYVLSKALELNPRLCDFDYIHSVSPMVRTSASDTSVFFATIGRDTQAIEIATKVFFTPVGLDIDNSLIMEQENYKLMNQIILKGWTPHLIAYVASFVCPAKALTNLPSDVHKNITVDLAKAVSAYPSQKIFSNVYGQAKERSFSFLITEKAVKAKSLKEWICDDSVSMECIKSVLFQVLFTLEVFNRIGFRHNDGHPGNILIEDHSTDKTMFDTTSYNIDGKLYTFRTKQNFVKIFDFDRSYFNCDVKNVPSSVHALIETYQKNLIARGVKISKTKCNNTVLQNNYCSSNGECNRLNDKYDTFLVLRSLLVRLKNCPTTNKKELMNFLAANTDGVPKSVIYNEPPEIPEGYWLLKQNKDYKPTDAEMPTTLSMLHSDFFTSAIQKGKQSPLIYSLPSSNRR